MSIVNIKKDYHSIAVYNGLGYIYPNTVYESEFRVNDNEDRKVHRVRRVGNMLKLLTFNVELDDKSVFLKETSSLTIASILEDGTATYSEEALEILTKKYGYIMGAYELGEFIVDFIKQNKFIYSLFVCDDAFKSKIQTLLKSRNKEVPMIIFKNVIRNTVDTLEKIYKACGSDFFISNVCSSEMEFQNERKKLKQIMGLPDNVLQFLKQPEYASLYPILKDFSENRASSDSSLLIDFISTAIDVSKKYPKLSSGNYYNFIKTVVEIGNLTDTNMKTIINYLYAQSFNYTNGGSNLIVPTSEAITMRDYLSIAKKHHIEVDNLPGNIRAAHFYLVSNTCYAEDEEKNTAFKEAVKKYSYLEYSDEKYSVVIPKDIKDMMDEGTNMHHCIASYIDRVINGQIVLFCRKTDEINNSFISFEVSQELEFVQIKEKYDTDVTDEEVLNFLQKWRDEKAMEYTEEEKEAI